MTSHNITLLCSCLLNMTNSVKKWNIDCKSLENEISRDKSSHFFVMCEMISDLDEIIRVNIRNRINNTNNYIDEINELIDSRHVVIETPFIVLYAISILFSVLGNTAVILVMSCGFKSSRLNISIFLLNLAVFNLIMSFFCVPLTFLGTFFKLKWILMPLTCPLKSFFQNMSINGSILSLTYLSIDRYRAVVHPLKHKSKSTRSQIYFYFLLIWLFSCLIAFIKILVNKCFRFDFNDKIEAEKSYCNCIEWNPSLNYSAAYFFAYLLWNFIQAYLLPILIMFVLYSRVISILGQRADRTLSNLLHEITPNHARSFNLYESARKNASKTKKMLVLIMSIFILNWLPIHLFNFYSFYLHMNGNFNEKNNNYYQESKANNIIYYICQLISVSSTFINPICYSFMNNHFKTDFQDLCLCKANKNRNLIDANVFNRIRDSQLSHRSTLRRVTGYEEMSLSVIQKMAAKNKNLLLRPNSSYRSSLFSSGYCSTYV